MSIGLELRDLHVDRGRARVLRGVEMSLDSGELVVVTGPNGAGKTTLVEAIAGLVAVRRGGVLLNGEDLAGRGIAQRAALGLGITPQRRRLLPTMTVEDNLRLAARTWKLSRRDTTRRIRELADEVPIVGTKLHDQVRTLSGGQQQLVAIARSLICRPDVLVLDEPSFGLAPGTWASVVRTCRQLADDGGAVLLVEQRVLDAVDVADAVHLLHGGRLLSDAASLLSSDAFFRGGLP